MLPSCRGTLRYLVIVPAVLLAGVALLGPRRLAAEPPVSQPPKQTSDSRGQTEPVATRPNIVLMISDDHGWTDYGFLGHPHVRTPHLDRLASQSLVFRRGYVPSSLCCPSLASLITGLYPHQHKITSNDPPRPPGMTAAAFYQSAAFRDGREVMSQQLEQVPTLPRMLARQGFLSLQTGKWWQGSYARGGFTHGMTRGLRHGDDGLEIGRQTMQPIFDFIALAQREQKPFLVWYAPMLPHEPHDPPERLLNKYQLQNSSPYLARYGAMVEWFDETCGQLLDYLDQHALADNTIVVYVTDNGWVQNESGAGSIRSKRTPYDAGIRTPIMVRWPGRVQPRMSDHLALSLDIVPTLLNAVGATPPAALPGVNLLDETAIAERQAVFGACYTHDASDLQDPRQNLLWRWGVEGHWKLIVPDSPQVAQTLELYDLAADPREQQNLAERYPERVRALREKLDRWWNPVEPSAQPRK